jgi:hypothetical protein
MMDAGLPERLNALALVARTCRDHAFDRRRDRPDLLMQIITTGSISLKVTADNLPYHTSSGAVGMQATRFIAQVEGALAGLVVGACAARHGEGYGQYSICAAGRNDRRDPAHHKLTAARPQLAFS